MIKQCQPFNLIIQRHWNVINVHRGTIRLDSARLVFGPILLVLLSLTRLDVNQDLISAKQSERIYGGRVVVCLGKVGFHWHSNEI